MTSLTNIEINDILRCNLPPFTTCLTRVKLRCFMAQWKFSYKVLWDLDHFWKDFYHFSTFKFIVSYLMDFCSIFDQILQHTKSTCKVTWTKVMRKVFEKSAKFSPWCTEQMSNLDTWNLITHKNKPDRCKMLLNSTSFKSVIGKQMMSYNKKKGG